MKTARKVSMTKTAKDGTWKEWKSYNIEHMKNKVCEKSK